jgi:hypothetical protein
MRQWVYLTLIVLLALPTGAAAKTILPAPLTPSGCYANSEYGYSLTYPANWHAMPGLDGYLSLTNFTSESLGRNSLPAGGAKLELVPDVVAPPTVGKPFAVGIAGFPGMISLETADSIGLLAPGHSIQIFYQAAGRHWGVFGYFAEPVDQTNPNTRMFFAMVQSIRHTEIIPEQR